MEQIREQSRIRESNYEEEISILKEQVKDREAQTVSENIELIRLQQEKKTRTAQMTTLKAQLQGTVDNVWFASLDTVGPPISGFFFTVAKKLKAKKTQAMKKLKHFFGQKLKQPE